MHQDINNNYIWNFQPTKEIEDAYEQLIPVMQNLTKDYINKNLEEQEEILQQLLHLIRSINIFPIIYFNDKGIQKEIQSVIDKKDICIIDNTIFTQLRNGLLLLDYLFPNLHLAYTCNVKENIYNRFYDDDKLIVCLKRYLESGKVINNLRTVYFSTARFYWDTPINFSPMRAKIIYEHFCPKDGIIYDYSAGFGGRMLGALSSDKNFTYIGTDPNTNTYQNLLKLGSYIEINTKRKDSYKIYNLCSEQLSLPEKSIDFIFSCPPFFNKEIYCEETTQSISKFNNYNDWLEYYVRPTIRNCYKALKDTGVFSFDILNYYLYSRKIPLIEDWIKITQEEGFFFKEKIPIESRYRKKENEGEYLYLFMKNEQDILPNYTSQDLLKVSIDAKKERERRANRRANITICEYNIYGNLEKSYSSYEELNIDKKILKSKKIYNNKYYRIYYGDDIILTQIQVKQPILKIVDNEQYFYSYSELAKFLGVSRQAVQQAYNRHSTQILNQNIEWLK